MVFQCELLLPKKQAGQMPCLLETYSVEYPLLLKRWKEATHCAETQNAGTEEC